MDLEVEYWRWRERRHLLCWDKLTAGLGGALLLVLLPMGWVEEEGLLTLAGVLVMVAVELLALLRPDWYLPRRRSVLTGARIVLAWLHSWRRQGLLLLQPAWLSIGWQLPFSQHLAVQSAAALLTAQPNVEKVCHGAQGLQNLVSGMARGLDAIGAALLSLTLLSGEEGVEGLRESGEQCWGVAVFMNFWLGWVLPTIWVWLADRASRREFLTVECRNRFGLRMRLPKPCLVARFIWCCNIIFLMEVTWQILRQIEKKTW